MLILRIMLVIIVGLLPTGKIGAHVKKKKKDTLTRYQVKRDFTKTPEPSGKKRAKKTKEPVFVIHKHAASHLHYDVRLEVDGVLKSWAVPKGITTDPAQKHLAVATEDHPMSYLEFEGVIPQGEYGGGTVMVWDIGTYTNIKEKDGKLVPMERCCAMGRVEVELHGKKLNGAYALVRFKNEKDQWLLIKMNDAYAHKKIKNVTKSALSGKTMAQIAKEG